MALLTKKIRAFSLVETMVALTIIMMSFGIGLTIYINVFKSDRFNTKLFANANASEMLVNTKKLKTYNDEEVQYKTYSLTKKVSKYGQSDYLLQVSIIAKDKAGRKLLELKEVVIKDISASLNTKSK